MAPRPSRTWPIILAQLALVALILVLPTLLPSLALYLLALLVPLGFALPYLWFRRLAPPSPGRGGGSARGRRYRRG